jgi:tetratricopeptide (TPR) repeat protein
VEQSAREHLFDSTIALFGQWIAEKSDDADRYHLRAAFYTEIFERQKAIDDLGRALALKGDKALYRDRAGLYEALGDWPHAVADFKAALDLDPSDIATLGRLSRAQAMSGGGRKAGNVSTLLETGGKNEPFYHEIRRSCWPTAAIRQRLARSTRRWKKRSGNAGLLHERCFLKGLMNTDLDNALADCNRAIPWAGQCPARHAGQPGLVYLREHKASDAIASLNEAIDQRPGLAMAYFLRALAQREAGNSDTASGIWLRPVISFLRSRRNTSALVCTGKGCA